MTRAGIIGASGYTGEELVVLCLQHPEIELTTVASRSLAGKPLASALPRLRHLPGAASLAFIDATDPYSLAGAPVDVWFLALPHGVASTFIEALLPTGITIIDLSADFRLNDPAIYETYYGQPHPLPDLLAGVPYVIPELMQSDAWREAPLIACPGCYPTSIQIPLVPLLRNKVIRGDGIVINSASGVSGAGKKLAETYLFCERADSMTPYGLVSHRHVPEIEQQLSAAAGIPVVVQFTPHLIPIRRGIVTTITVPAGGSSLEALRSTWESAYHQALFVDTLGEGLLPDTSRVVNTNRVEIAAAHDPRTDNFIITSSLDNLLKGVAGQAIQILNHMLRLPESTGLPR